MFAGGAARTTAVATDDAEAAPPPFVAVTTARTVEPTSAGVRPYVAAVAPAIATQPAPEPSQRCHWNEYVTVRELRHEPDDAVSVSPSTGEPETTGGFVLTGGAGTTAAVGPDAREAVPAEFDAVTTASSVESMSPVATA